MDTAAARMINILVGNDDNGAVIEMHFPAAEIVFGSKALAALGGADLGATLDDHPVENWRTFVVKKGEVLKFGRKVSGNRAYLAVHGGFKIEEWLGSSSTNLAAKIGGQMGRKIESGEKIDFRKIAPNQPLKLTISPSLIPFYSQFPTVRIVTGAEYELLSKNSRDRLTDQDFTVSNSSNRMGFRLAGEPITIDEPRELVSSAASFGTIQLLPDGQLIVLMADHQTAGGYPRIAHVITKDLPLLAQLGANDKVAFHLVSIEDAEKLSSTFEKELNFLRVGCRLLS